MSGRKHVLVVDDNEDIADIVCATAESLRRPCTTAADIPSVLAALTPDVGLIFMDLRMPGLSGQDLMAQLAARRCKAGLVLMSGVGPVALKAAEEQGRSLGLNVIGSLPKPFRGTELRAMLAH